MVRLECVAFICTFLWWLLFETVLYSNVHSKIYDIESIFFFARSFSFILILYLSLSCSCSRCVVIRASNPMIESQSFLRWLYTGYILHMRIQKRFHMVWHSFGNSNIYIHRNSEWKIQTDWIRWKCKHLINIFWVYVSSSVPLVQGQWERDKVE